MFLFIYLLCLGNGAFLVFYEAYDVNLLDTFALGGMFLRPSAVSLLFYVGFFPTVNGEQENRVQKGNGYFQVPPHTPVIFGEAGGRTLFRYKNLKI